MGKLGRSVVAVVAALALGQGANAGPSVSPAEGPPAVNAEPLSELDAMNKRTGELAAAAEYEEALSLAQRTAEKARAQLGEESAPYARALSWQAFLQQLRGRFERAEPLFKRSLEIYEKVHPPGHSDIATAINNLGFHYQSVDKLVPAEEHYKRALEMREKVLEPDDPLIADSLNNLAQAYKRQWRIEEAEPLLKRSLEIRAKKLKPDDPLIAQSLTNIGSTLEMEGRFSAAEPYFRKAMTIRKASQPPDHPDIAGLTNKLAQNLSKQGRHADADTLFREVVDQRYRTLATDHVDIATSLHDSASNLLAMKRNPEAKSQLRTAIAIRQSALPPLHPSIAETQALLAHAELADGNVRQALSYMRIAAVSLAARGKSDDVAKQSFSDFVSIAWRAYERESGAARDRLFSEALEMAQRASHTETEAEVARMSARFASRDERLESLIRDRQELERETQRVERDLSAVLAIGITERGDAAQLIRAQLVALSDRIKVIDRDVRAHFPAYFELVTPDPVTLEDIRRHLKPDEAIVYYLCAANDETYMWAITRDDVLWRRLETSYGELSASVGRLRRTLDLDQLQRAGTQPALFDLGLAHQLHDNLLAAASPLLKGKSSLIVVPSGPLTSLPFQVLVKSKPEVRQPTLNQLAAYRKADWLMHHHAISVLPALTSLRALRAQAVQPGSRKPFVGFGNPLFSRHTPAAAPLPAAPAAGSALPATIGAAERTQSQSYTSFWRGPAANLDALRTGLPPLPETESELLSVASRFAADVRDVILGENATEAAVKRADLASYRIVYFATHGLVAGELKGLGEPALAFTLPDTPSDLDDGLLTASEVSQLRLNAEWVILSACNTAAGNAPGAEALSGLARSFFHAGARTLLVSHWRIGSQAATRLTTSAFAAQHRDPGVGRAEALRRAMRELAADTSDPWNAYPTFWAAFMVVGDGDGRAQ